MKNVLVFPCGSEIGLEIHRSLEYSKEFNLYGASSIKDHGSFVYENYIPNIPFFNEANFIKEINKIIEKYKIDFIFPAHDDVILELIKNKEKIKAQIITSSLETCEICRSKKKTYTYFKNKIKTPIVYGEVDTIKKYPVFVKPDIGQGSKGAQLISSKEELLIIMKKDPSIIIMENLPGKEYTVDCFTDSSGKLKFIQARERRRIFNGISANSKPIISSTIKKIGEIINKNLTFNGVWFFQLKQNNKNQLVLLEIAPRVAGTMALCRMQGVNLPLLSLYNKMGLNVEIFKNKFQIEIDRSLCSKYKTNIKYKNVYIDLDDTLIIKNKINTSVIKYIYQCKNEGKKIYLITKHKYNLKKTLKKYMIPDIIFNKIIHLKMNENKYSFIQNNSIFIDDSFSERQEVYKQIKIPVFSLDTIEILLK